MSVQRQAAVASVGTEMQRYQRATQQFDDAVGRLLGLGAAEMRCLDWLTEGPITAGELATASGLRPAATTTLIDRLTAKGFVRRTASESDRRRVLVELTSEGRDRIWQAYGPLAEGGPALLEHLDLSELQATAALLRAMTAFTEEHRRRVTTEAGPRPVDWAPSRPAAGRT